jgi:protein-L-isoaspartate O-methyltransferase
MICSALNISENILEIGCGNGWLSALLQKKGLITQQELDFLDELVKKTKLKMLQEDSVKSISKYGLYIAIVFFAFGTLWLITKDKKNGQ